MYAFLIQLTYLLAKSISTNLRQKKRGKIGNGEWWEWGIMRMHVSCKKYFTGKWA